MLFWVQHLFFTLFYSLFYSVNMYDCIVNVIIIIIIMTYSLYSCGGGVKLNLKKRHSGSIGF